MRKPPERIELGYRADNITGDGFDPVLVAGVDVIALLGDPDDRVIDLEA